jgi:signal transduction histidine kinase
MVVLTREQLEDRLAALHQASIELVSDLTTGTVLERIVHLARDLAKARYAALGVVDEEGSLKEFLTAGISDEQSERIGDHPVGIGLLGLFKHNRETFRISSISGDPRSSGFPPNHPVMNSFLGVPILSGDHWLGQIYLADKEGYHKFTVQDERVIETLAAYAAVAITNARLYEGLLERDTTLRKRNQDLGLINAVASALVGSLDVDEILGKTLDLVMDHLEIEIGEIFLTEDGERLLHLAMHRGDMGEAFWTRDVFRIGEGPVGSVAESGIPIVNLNLKKEASYIRRAVFEAGYRSIGLIPLLAHSNVVGVMAIATRNERTLAAREIDLLSSIGNWAGINIENARLNRQSQRLAILEERERIGMDLHDGIIQSIYGVGLALDYAKSAIDEDPNQARKKIDQSIKALNTTIRDIRSYILDLRPRQFHGENLHQGITRLVREIEANSDIEVKYIGPDNALIDFPADHATALFHICQEALANAAKHSSAKRAEVHLWAAMDRVLLEVTDDGRGFNLRKMNFTLGHGLSNIHYRARKVGGDVEFTSYPGEGTTVLAWVPRWEARP